MGPWRINIHSWDRNLLLEDASPAERLESIRLLQAQSDRNDENDQLRNRLLIEDELLLRWRDELANEDA